MNDEQKRIEEMAKAMCEEYDTDICKHECPMATDCANILIAKRLIAAGYRKQSDTVKEFVCKVLQIGSKRPLCLFNEYKEGYTDCLDQIKELAAQYGVEVGRMREILFRGKRVDNGEEVEGFYVNVPEHYKQEMSGKSYIVSINNGLFIEVVPETVRQYTGLTDKNGKKIFEGDILRGYQYPYLSDDNFNYYVEVIYFDNCPAFGIYTFKNPNLNIVSGISSGNTDFMEDWESEKWEIIGNIYDNPELLEVEE